MPKEWYLTGASTYFSGCEKENFNNYVDGFEQLLQMSPEAEDVLIDGEKHRVIIQNTMEENITKTNIRYMLSHIGVSRAGFYVDYKGSKWLVSTAPDDNKMYEKSIIERCNYDLKWIDGDNLIIKPAIISAKTLYTTGVKNRHIVQIPDGMVGIILPYDNNTKKINRDWEFVFNKTKYKVTFYNEVQYDGIISLICSELSSEFDENTDDLENNIANRWINGKDRLGIEDKKAESGLIKPKQPQEPEPTPEEPEPESEELKIYAVDEKYENGFTVWDKNVAYTVNTDKPIKWGTKGKKATFHKIDGNTISFTVDPDNQTDALGDFILKATLVEDENIYAEKELSITFM